MTAPNGGARAQSTKLKLGVLNDQSGAYRGNGGPVSVACAQQAVKEFAAASGLNVEIVVADHQGKADVALGIARQWFDRDGVDVAMDFQNSAIALAVAGLAKEKDKVALVCNSGTTDLTGKQCSPNTLHWAYDTYMLAKVTGGALTKSGGDTWFFITADYAFGHALESDTAKFVQQAGGKILGNVNMPFPSADFSSALLQAQSSGTKVVGFANAGTDTVNCIKQAAEFGLVANGIKMAGLLLQINDIGALGLQAAQGLSLAETFYWDLNERTRAFSSRVSPATSGVMPNASQAACYSAVVHYMKAAAAMGPGEAKKSGAAMVAKMKAMPVDDDATGTCTIRQDGRVMNDAYLFEVKSPAASKKPWDYYKLVATVPAADAFRSLADGGCAFIKS
ncbi:ABC transporter substrate-binding protein [Acidisphaera sp. L21]|uniref:ABC transporter substrate-binding protein n=1 Tax=Acidisphaera sp. L21 TaxID=1641851 RepID=UPI0020B14D09|nr:ABC transporter substrate-binding protein [Acidisphaera sp. L21]